jgi:hypothetical protein
MKTIASSDHHDIFWATLITSPLPAMAARTLAVFFFAAFAIELLLLVNVRLGP